ncbi:hypothetical protein SI65_09033 [Aspergillus cristatus]|uniref:Uncharacterized protein n=1 Tax=Aspergillus cristatus TaxID=573508 RepID=A0A1E3B393_ASPCR|nr:hypothetical protein SI65_09033 [Aspergillus cristatus]
MPCPITVSKFVGTVSLGLLTGLSYTTTTVTIPSLKLLPTSTSAARSLAEAKRLSRNHSFRLTNIANTTLLLAYLVSPRHRKHPYLVWMCVTSALGSYGVDYWFNRQAGIKNWVAGIWQESYCARLLGKGAQGKKEEDIVVVEAEEGGVNGERVQEEMEEERVAHLVRGVVSGVALAMGIVGLWGDRK